tara:strand:+ start:65108 stop:65245 length:138 start_codon:yes stop_codon:yes gene_type:complete
MKTGKGNGDRQGQFVLYGEKCLTTPNPEQDSDTTLFAALGPITAT